MTQNNNLISFGNKEISVKDNIVYWRKSILHQSISSPNQIKYGIAPMEVDMYNIGVKLIIELKNAKNQSLRIAVRSYFGFRYNQAYAFFNQAIDLLMKHFLENEYDNMLQSWEEGKLVTFGKIEVGKNHVTKSVLGKSIQIDFNDLNILQRRDHFVLASISNPNQYFSVHHLKDWNWPFIQMLVEHILNQKTENH